MKKTKMGTLHAVIGNKCKATKFAKMNATSLIGAMAEAAADPTCRLYMDKGCETYTIVRNGRELIAAKLDFVGISKAFAQLERDHKTA